MGQLGKIVRPNAKEVIMARNNQDSHEEDGSPHKPFPPVHVGIAVVATGLAVGAMFALPQAVGAILIGAAVIALIALLGAAGWYIYTCLMAVEYRTNPARAARLYGFPTYAAWYAAQPWWVRAISC